MARPRTAGAARPAPAWIAPGGCVVALVLALPAGCRFAAQEGPAPRPPESFVVLRQASAPGRGLNRLRVRTERGAISVRSGPGKSVLVDAKVSAVGPHPPALLEAWAEQVRLDLARKGDRLDIDPVLPVGIPPSAAVQVDLSIRAPRPLALDLDTGSGIVQAELPSVPGETRLHSSWGDVGAMLPPRADAQVEARSESGSVELVGVPGQPAGDRPREWRGRLGAGGSRLVLETRSGTARLEQR